SKACVGLMPPTAGMGGGNLSGAAAGRLFLSPELKERASLDELFDRVPRRRRGGRAPPRRQPGGGATARRFVSLCDPVRERQRLAGDGPLCRLFRLQGPRWLPALAAVPHHRDPRRLYDVLDLLARHRAAL